MPCFPLHPTSIKVLSKKGPHSKRFDSMAAQITQALYALYFGPPMVTKKVIRSLNIRHVLWIEGEEGTPIAAMMVMFNSMMGYYRVSGLVVDVRYQRQGFGAALMEKVMTEVLPDGAELQLGVDTEKETTEWLRQWYARLGFKEKRAATLQYQNDEILMSRVISKLNK
jgi:GNAT superfamily N-acetyltransferase